MAEIEGLLLIERAKRDRVNGRRIGGVLEGVRERIHRVEGVLDSYVIRVSDNQEVALLAVRVANPSVLSRHLAGENVASVHRSVDARNLKDWSRRCGRAFADAAAGWEAARKATPSAKAAA